MRKLDHADLSAQRLLPGEVNPDRFPIALVLHDIRSTYNVGSIFRSADAARVARVLLSGYSPDPALAAVRKTALGAHLTVPWERTTVENGIGMLRSAGYRIVALELTDASHSLYDFTVGHLPIAFIAGNEITGIPQHIIDMCDTACSIPMFGAKHSLNVAVAVGTALLHCANVYSPNCF